MAEHFAPTALVKQAKRSGALRVALVVAAILAVGACLQVGSPWLRRAGLVPEHKPYVALSLPHPTNLPAHLGAGGRLVFTFAVTNYTGSAIEQTWEASAVSTGRAAHSFRAGEVAVPAGRSRSVTVHATLATHAAPVEIEVSLPGRDLAPVEFHLGAVDAPRKAGSR